jgi:repressor LexA
MKTTLAENIRNFRKAHGLTQAELGKIAGVSDKAVSTWEKGTAQPRMGAIQRMADYFNEPKSLIIEGKRPPSHFRVPVLGSVHAGIPHEMVEEIPDEFEDLSTEDFREDPKEYFCLRVKGDCMKPRICEGDVVVVHKQPDAESGQIVIAAVNGEEGYCKKLMKYPENNSIALIPLNPTYAPQVFSEAEISSLPVTIFGVVVELRAKF